MVVRAVEPMVAFRKARQMPSLAGFTLVELLVVIGIIAVLISVLLPSLNKARQAAQNVQCLSNLKQLYLSLVFYSQDNKGMFPAANGKVTVGTTYQYPVPRNLGRQDEAKFWVKEPRLWTCPADKTNWMDATPGGYANQYLGDVNISYGYNQTAGMLENQTSPLNYFHAYRPSKSKGSAYDAIMFDAEAGTLPTTDASHWTYLYSWARLEYTVGMTPTLQLNSARHQGNSSINIVGGDGHAESLNIKDFPARLVYPLGGANGSLNNQLRGMFKPWQAYVVRKPDGNSSLRY